ncbi:EamA-like transporter family protein [Palleronia aestuarii]|uniref:EamA-like transporter family protein n=1 Tax=Palleronia aestuarii TaxID=568105 RepID=A0A2W7NYD0_9RHOB|nr:DMT family transporter [Palleronia aestuarii]PZX16202.1 EamA-like transporter family protein [Palleronia aestuarii]
MSTSVFLAVLLAAALHATWNAVVKGGADKHFSMAAVMLGHLPFAFVIAPLAPLPDPACLPWLFAGMVLHLGYQFFLLAAYRVGDLTQVYPIARGVAPLLVAGISVMFLGLHLAGLQAVAILTIACGIMSLALVRRGDGQANPKGAALALATGCFIAGYSLVDGIGARAAGTGIGFYAWLAIGNGIVFALVTAVLRPDVIPALLRRGKRQALLSGGASYAAYALVVWAFTQAPIALVTAVRETSIVFALLIGVFVLGERLNLAKLVSTMTTLLGVILLRSARP